MTGLARLEDAAVVALLLLRTATIPPHASAASVALLLDTEVLSMIAVGGWHDVRAGQHVVVLAQGLGVVGWST